MDNEIRKLKAEIAGLRKQLNDWAAVMPELKHYVDDKVSDIGRRVDDSIHQTVEASKKTERVALAQSEHALKSLRSHVLAFTREVS